MTSELTEQDSHRHYIVGELVSDEQADEVLRHLGEVGIHAEVLTLVARPVTQAEFVTANERLHRDNEGLLSNFIKLATMVRKFASDAPLTLVEWETREKGPVLQGSLTDALEWLRWRGEPGLARMLSNVSTRREWEQRKQLLDQAKKVSA